MLHVGSSVDGQPLTRAPKRKAPRGTPKFQASVNLPKVVGFALREVARSQERSLSDLVSDACVYWLDINVPAWRDPAEEAHDGA